MPPRTVTPLAPGDRVVIIGAGPAGLTAAHWLAARGARVTVLEGDSIVGGISRTVAYNGYRFDIGGHRFFTKIRPVEELWQEILGGEIHQRPAAVADPLQRPLLRLSARCRRTRSRASELIDAMRIVLSYLRWHYKPYPVEENFEQWVTNRFGKRLYEIFFKTYTEKVWGIPCTEIRAEWAAQRIQGLSLARAILIAASLNRRSTDDQDPDPRVPVSATRPGTDVGDLPRRDRGDGPPGAAQASRHPPRAVAGQGGRGGGGHARRQPAVSRPSTSSRPCPCGR